ncbi:YaeQ family protein [Salinicola sp. DM10]|uniref:YaeQ family protein n=1 Tax=Salinicola sp. DM10 TaxID=2815721 RepID=UPI001A8C6D9B|nr:YaeQ family protein [Salinicola sp. DM10]
MALGATIYKARLNVSDLDHHYYATHALTVACHPSETATRLMVRLLAFIDNAHTLNAPAHEAPGELSMTRGLSSDDEPDLWLTAADGRILAWIELGEPSLKRIKQGLSRAETVIVYPYSPRSAEQWWKKLGDGVRALPRVRVMSVPAAPLETLTGWVARSMSVDATRMEGQWLLTDGQTTLSLELDHWNNPTEKTP